MTDHASDVTLLWAALIEKLLYYILFLYKATTRTQSSELPNCSSLLQKFHVTGLCFPKLCDVSLGSFTCEKKLTNADSTSLAHGQQL